MSSFKFAGRGQMLDGRVLEASQVEYEPFGKPPLQREVSSLKSSIQWRTKSSTANSWGARQRPTCAPLILKCTTISYTSNSLAQASETPPWPTCAPPCSRSPRPRHLPGIEALPSPRQGEFFPAVVLRGDNCLKFQRTYPAEPRQPDMEARS